MQTPICRGCISSIICRSNTHKSSYAVSFQDGYARKIYFNTVVGVHINKRRRLFCLSFDFITSFFQIKSFQVNKEKLQIVSFSLFPCLCVSKKFKSLGNTRIKVVFFVLISTTTTVCLPISESSND